MRENEGSEYIFIIKLLKKIFGKHSKVFQKFEDIANELIKLSSLRLFLHMCTKPSSSLNFEFFVFTLK